MAQLARSLRSVMAEHVMNARMIFVFDFAHVHFICSKWLFCFIPTTALRAGNVLVPKRCIVHVGTTFFLSSIF